MEIKHHIICHQIGWEKTTRSIKEQSATSNHQCRNFPCSGLKNTTGKHTCLGKFRNNTFQQLQQSKIRVVVEQAKQAGCKSRKHIHNDKVVGDVALLEDCLLLYSIWSDTYLNWVNPKGGVVDCFLHYAINFDAYSWYYFSRCPPLMVTIVWSDMKQDVHVQGLGDVSLIHSRVTRCYKALTDYDACESLLLQIGRCKCMMFRGLSMVYKLRGISANLSSYSMRLLVGSIPQV